MMNYIWIALLVISIIVAGITGRADALTKAAVDSAKTAVEISIGLVGVMSLWLGIMKIAEEAKAAGLSTMECPRCDGHLKEIKFEEVLIDTCEKCGGIWLDSGELDQLLKRDNDSWFGRYWFSEG